MFRPEIKTNSLNAKKMGLPFFRVQIVLAIPNVVSVLIRQTVIIRNNKKLFADGMQ